MGSLPAVFPLREVNRRKVSIFLIIKMTEKAIEKYRNLQSKSVFESIEGQIELHINFLQFLSGMVFKLMCFSEKLSQQAI